MSYKLIYTKSAVKDIQDLDAVAKHRLQKKLEIYVLNPLHYAKNLHTTISVPIAGASVTIV